MSRCICRSRSRLKKKYQEYKTFGKKNQEQEPLGKKTEAGAAKKIKQLSSPGKNSNINNRNHKISFKCHLKCVYNI